MEWQNLQETTLVESLLGKLLGWQIIATQGEKKDEKKFFFNHSFIDHCVLQNLSLISWEENSCLLSDKNRPEKLSHADEQYYDFCCKNAFKLHKTWLLTI